MIIYKATNEINGMVYIGQTTQQFIKRKNDHLINAKNGSNFYFHKAIRKYGKDNFEWEILHQTNKEDYLNILEKFYILYYRTKCKLYNLTDGGEGTKGIKRSEKVRKNMSLAHKGNIPWNKGKKGIYSDEYIRKLSESHKGKVGANSSFYGKHHSKETKAHWSSIRKGQNTGINNPMFGKKHSIETRKKISEKSKGKKHTEEARIKMSHPGKNHPMYGKHHTLETRQKMVLAWKKRKQQLSA
jgi:group I intron endonuclease